MSATNNEAVQTEHLTKIYKDFWGRDKVRALDDLNLTIHRGEVFGLLGPNGSGKSTTIKLLLGLIFAIARHGRRSWAIRPAARAINEHIGFLPGGIVSLPVPQRRGDAEILRPAFQNPPQGTESPRFRPCWTPSASTPRAASESSANIPRAWPAASGWRRP